MAYAPMDTSQIFGMMCYLHILAAFAVMLHLLLEDVLIPDDMLREMVVQSIDDCNLPPLTESVKEEFRIRIHRIPPKGRAFNMIINALKPVF